MTPAPHRAPRRGTRSEVRRRDCVQPLSLGVAARATSSTTRRVAATRVGCISASVVRLCLAANTSAWRARWDLAGALGACVPRGQRAAH